MTAPSSAPAAPGVAWIVPPRSSPVAGAVLAGLGVASLAWAAADVASAPSGSLVGLLLRGGFPGLLGALLLLTGSMVRNAKGGMSLDRATGGLALHGRSAADRLLLPADLLVRARLTHRDRAGADGPERLWALELETRAGATVLLGEGPVRDELLGVLQALAPSLPCPAEEEAEPAGPGPIAPDAPRPAGVATAPIAGGVRHTFAVRGSWAMSGVLTLLGGLSLLVGVLLMANVSASPLSGFLVGPPLAMLGAVLLLVSATKALAVEEVDLVGGEVAHRFRLLGVAFAERRLPRGARPYARLRPRGAQGTCLEIVAEGGALMGASGVTSSTRGLDLPGLLGLAALLTRELTPS